MNKKILTLLFLLAISGCAALRAQTSGTNSAYSRYGWGNRSDVLQSSSLGMSGVSLARRGGTILNVNNPASLSAIDSLTFLLDVGMTATIGQMKYGGTSVHPKNATFDYATAAFRLFKHLGFAVSMQPYTYIGYNFSTTVTLDDIDGYGENDATYSYLGEGGTHKVVGGLGWEPFKGFSVGVNGGYLWGDYSHTSSVTFSSSSIQSLYRYYLGDLSTYTLEFGTQISFPLGKKATLTLGLTYGLGHKIDQTATFINQKTGSGAVVGGDTTYLHNAYEIPATFGAGAMLDLGGKWLIGVDYTFENWDGCRYPQLVSENDEQIYLISTEVFSNRHRVAAGVQYTPDPMSFHWRDHINYRVGVSYTTPYAKVDGEDGATTYAVSAGVGIPINNRYTMGSVLSVAFEYQHVDPSSSKSIKEDYLCLRIGLLFNGRWFQKWKVE